MLAVYGKAAHVALGIEPIPRTEPAGFVNGIDALDLRGFSPDKAVALLVGYDSRYTFKKRGNRFLIYPREAAEGASILDAKLSKFVRSKESLDSLVAGLLSQVGASDVRTPMIRPIRDPLPAGTLDAVNSTPISVSVGRDTPAREVLDEICAAAGSLSWSLPAPVATGLHGPRYRSRLSLDGTASRPRLCADRRGGSCADGRRGCPGGTGFGRPLDHAHADDAAAGRARPVQRRALYRARSRTRL
jgi:hypothetical protein